jgi:hypothetical protein
MRGARYHRLNWPDLNQPHSDDLPSFRPLGLTAARLIARRWMFYLLATLAAIGVQIAFVLAVHVKAAALYPELIVPPLLITIVTVFIAGDATGTMTVAQRWERILERAWAVIIIDMGITFVGSSGLVTMQAGAHGGDPGNLLFGFLAMLLSGMLVYAEPFALLEARVQALTVIPFAILRSMMLAWVNLSRIFALLAVAIAADMISLFVLQKSPQADAAWVEIVIDTLLTAPLAALFTVAYLDTLAIERQTIP